MVKSRGIGTTTIAIIVVVVAVVASGVGYYLATKEGEGEGALEITTTSLPDGVVGVAYSATLVASGGTTPYTWENIGSLPDGLILSTGGMISGTPTTAGDFGFTVKVTDSSSPKMSDNQALSIHVEPAAAPLGITTTSLPDGTVGVAYNQTLQATGGIQPYTWSIDNGNLPGGLSLSAGGTISGAPTTAGDFGFTVKVTDSAANTDTKALSIHVKAAGESIIASATSLDFKVDVTSAGETITYRYRARNIGTGNMDLRLDTTLPGPITGFYIFSENQQTGWIYLDPPGQWWSFSGYGIDFSTYWGQYSGALEQYIEYLGDWTSGEYSCSYFGVTYRFYDIQVNPDLPDSVFQHG